ncbi:hypothetical protein [Bradyrhizobium sp. CCBAU 51627]|uniref:hypothetical protein n=1 Tax=Bradyrhizobium sp. CCBAU 51627 TaxID=1325088 RepID=UPI002305CFFB|nr:hypothetical protein [Bradyrhizobium sp. CCBAU 51627]MDA9433228.1 hypothetical protein [Bradyrhizobium sp. CCBAU 51627]
MEDYSKLLKAIAAFIGAFAWPVTILAIVSFFRSELKATLGTLPLLLDRVRKATISGVALELDRIADAETDKDKGNKITPGQIEAATRISVQAKGIGQDDLAHELDRLCLEYDSLRLALPSGVERTRAMTRVVVKMRSLAPSAKGFIDVYKGSGSPGSRLAAIAMMQMVPSVADLDWLAARFEVEQQPFLLYHASLALQNAANVSNTIEQKAHLRQVAEKALAQVKDFRGAPDQGTIEVLEMLLSSLPKQ